MPQGPRLRVPYLVLIRKVGLRATGGEPAAIRTPCHHHAAHRQPFFQSPAARVPHLDSLRAFPVPRRDPLPVRADADVQHAGVWTQGDRLFGVVQIHEPNLIRLSLLSAGQPATKTCPAPRLSVLRSRHSFARKLFKHASRKERNLPLPRSTREKSRRSISRLKNS